jgi:hypothetical protein
MDDDTFESECAAMYDRMCNGQVTQDEFADWVEDQCVAAVLGPLTADIETDARLLN